MDIEKVRQLAEEKGLKVFVVNRTLSWSDVHIAKDEEDAKRMSSENAFDTMVDYDESTLREIVEDASYSVQPATQESLNGWDERDILNAIIEAEEVEELDNYHKSFGGEDDTKQDEEWNKRFMSMVKECVHGDEDNTEHLGVRA